MTNAGELKFWQLQNSPEKKEKKARSLTSVRVTSLPTWEESKNLETILLLLLFFYFHISILGVLKKVFEFIYLLHFCSVSYFTMIFKYCLDSFPV